MASKASGRSSALREQARREGRPGSNVECNLKKVEEICTNLALMSAAPTPTPF